MPVPDPCRVAILLPSPWQGGMLRTAIALTQVLGACRAPDGRAVAPVLGLPADGDDNWRDIAHAIEAQGRAAPHPFPVRRMRWVFRSAPETVLMHGLDATASWPARMAVPTDGLHDFRDCDAWIVFGSMTEGYVVPLRPRAVFCADLPYRYVAEPSSWFTPEIRERMAETFLGWRHARAVFTTTPRTASDLVTFAGVPGALVRLLPTPVDPPSGPVPAPRPPGETILWVTNAAAHRNHARTLAALRRYWDELGGRFDVAVCGPGTEALRPGASDHPMARALEADAALASRIRVLGRLDDASYLAAVADSGFVLHNALTDGFTFAGFDAARAGRHFVGSDHQAMRHLAERYGIDTIWYDPRDVAALATALMRAEAAARAGEVPRHAPRADDPAARLAAYQALLHQVLA